MCSTFPHRLSTIRSNIKKQVSFPPSRLWGGGEKLLVQFLLFN